MTFEEMIAPRDPERFWSETWESSTAHVSGRAANHFHGVATEQEIDGLLFACGALPSDAVKLYRSAKPAPTEGAGGSTVPAATLRALHGQGLTIVVESADRFLPRLAEMLAALEDRFKARSMAHLVVSPAGVEGLAPHSDGYGIFVLQIAGTKTWSLYEDGARATANHGIDRHELIGSEPSSRVEMAAGDLLYLPRGTVHAAATGDERSIHIAVALIPPRGADVLALLGRAAEDDPFFRDYVPYGIGETAVARADYADAFRARLQAPAGDTDIFELLDRRRAERAASGREVNDGSRVRGHGPERRY